ncbi:hypothetical protein AB0F15_00835 [Amycolatopsis sp. NPDC026612]
MVHRRRALVEAQGFRMLTDPALWGKDIDDQRFLVVARPNE